MSEVQSSPTAEAKPSGAGAIKLILGLIVVSIIWYLFADRLTPYTDQARVQSFVVGVAPQVSGRVVEINVKNNQRVEVGTQLFAIDPVDYEIALTRAESEYKKAVDQISAGDAGVEAARAQLTSAEARLDQSETEYNRLNALFKADRGTISERRLESAAASLAQAEAGVKAAQANIDKAIESKGGDDRDNNAILKTAASQVAKAKRDLENTRVVAAKSGVITDLRAEVGQFAGAGKPLLTLVANDALWINAEFTENNLGHLAAGVPVGIVFDAIPGEVFEGSVRSVGLGVAAGNSPPPGTLPTIQNSRDWLRPAQRFPVEIEFDLGQLGPQSSQLRIGGQAAVMAFPDPPFPMSLLGDLVLWVNSKLTYAY